MKFILIIFGTRPEAIKMAPVIKALQKNPEFIVKVCVTAQHRQMLDQVISLFEITPDYDLDIMRPSQDLTDITVQIILGVRDIVSILKPDLILVHGDTTTAFAAGMAAFYAGIPIGHIEAGLRTDNPQSPWPEEMNRRLLSVMAELHFAPTEQAQNNLIRENIPSEKIHVCGNTLIDSLKEIQERLQSSTSLQKEFSNKFSFIGSDKRIILVTCHRRENFGEGITNICTALKSISTRNDVEIIYPVHLNPNIQEPVKRLLSNHLNIHLISPQDYLPFVYLMNRSYVLLTDSGGIQEEASSLGKPVLLMRDNTERPEAIESGTVKLVGTSSETIIYNCNLLLDNPDTYYSMSKSHDAYGNGKSAECIARKIKQYFMR